MEENKQKMDDATLVDSEKLSEEDMDNVAGGTWTESRDLWEAMRKNCGSSTVLGQKGWNLWNMGWYTFKRILSDVGIDANTSTGGGVGIGSVNNTYRDKETGQFLLQKEVIEYLETGKKSWRK